ncbi:aminotransferase [Lactiplantibacillus fabifermentans T30PCM01]|uniref:Aminotransferase n=1 Tax=Lactiplantibacillus fabifermentans T30PCM01 TaxID=1400520 RepID=W6TCI1_9LACO|nr:aminotransferase [Lactiplantibacillus fabifermentans]ETY74430.1 aminotransferase [Lactiplantibacillus fabifermentans T30PCM01]
MEIAGFGVEAWLNEFEKTATTDISQSSIAALTMQAVTALDGQQGQKFYAQLNATRLDYGWIEGSPEFKQQVSGLYQHVPADNVLQTNGATGANHLAIYSLINPGDHVIALYPSYQQLYDIPKSLGATVDFWHIQEDHAWLPDIDELAQLIRPETKMILLNNAVNPTGSLLDEALLKQVVTLARSVGAYVLADEVYEPLDDTPFVSIADLYEKGIAVNSLSKTYSAPGVRIGWTATPSVEITEIFRKYRDYTMICGGVFNDQLAVLILQHRAEILARNREIVRRNLKIYTDWVAQEPRVTLIAPHGISVSCPRLDIPVDDEKFCRDLLAQTGTLLVPGSRFDLPGHVRLGYCTDTETLQRGLHHLSQFLRQYDAD